MVTEKQTYPVLTRVIQFTCAITILAISLTSIVGWITSNSFLTSLGSNYIPMAPTTAILFLLISLSYLLLLAARRNSTVRIIALTSAIIVVTLPLTIFILGLFNIHPSFEKLGFDIAHTSGKTLIGHMSPVTSFLLTLAGITVIILMICRKSFFSSFFPPLISGTIFLTSVVLLIGYAAGKPLLYSTGQIPVALNTAIAFFAVGVLLVLESTYNLIIHEDREAREKGRSIHVFSMAIALMITGIMFFGYLNIQTILKNLQEELRIQLTLIAESKAKDIQRHIESGNDPDLLASLLVWPVPEKPGQIWVVPDTSNITGVAGYKGMAEVMKPDWKKYEICIVEI